MIFRKINYVHVLVIWMFTCLLVDLFNIIRWKNLYWFLNYTQGIAFMGIIKCHN